MKMLKSFKPIINEKSKILILGSMPGIKSLEATEYYAHPNNRFWKIMAVICNRPNLEKADYKTKTETLLKNNIALWDTIKSCEREGSLDSNIQKVIPNDISKLLKQYKNIEKICCNGLKSYSLFNKHFKELKIKAICLPSTSPANAKYSFNMLLDEWIKLISK